MWTVELPVGLLVGLAKSLCLSFHPLVCESERYVARYTAADIRAKKSLD